MRCELEDVGEALRLGSGERTAIGPRREGRKKCLEARVVALRGRVAHADEPRHVAAHRARRKSLGSLFVTHSLVGLDREPRGAVVVAIRVRIGDKAGRGQRRIAEEVEDDVVVLSVAQAPEPSRWDRQGRCGAGRRIERCGQIVRATHPNDARGAAPRRAAEGAPNDGADEDGRCSHRYAPRKS